jgi:hypothetical protein
VVGDRWVVSHRSMGAGLSLRRTSRPLEHGSGVPEGQSGDHACLWIAGLVGFKGMLPAEIAQACAGLRAQPIGDHVCVYCQFGRS